MFCELETCAFKMCGGGLRGIFTGLTDVDISDARATAAGIEVEAAGLIDVFSELVTLTTYDGGLRGTVAGLTEDSVA